MDSDDEYLAEFSDEGGVDSSDDDELVMKEFYKQSKVDKMKSTKDFENEMEEELEKRVAAHLKKEDFEDPTDSGTREGIKETNPRDKYFDTDSEEDVDNEDPTAQAHSNLELFYDPQMDSKDEAYVEKQRNSYRKSPNKQVKQKPTPNSDAVLNCPACFTTLCHDCQRHETYKTQYRAMFTKNCNVDLSEVMKIPLQSQKNRSKKALVQTSDAAFNSDDAEETYHPVRCLTCNTHVAMLDRDEVYHFFNVVTSH